MAMGGAQITFGPTATQLRSVVPASMKQLDVLASPDNNDNVYIGGESVASDPTDVWAVLLPGKPWGAKASEREEVKINEDVYIVGTEGESAHLIWVV